MEKYDTMLAAALRSIADTFRSVELAGLSRDRGGHPHREAAAGGPGQGLHPDYVAGHCEEVRSANAMTDSLTYVLRARLDGLAGGTSLRAGAVELLKALGYESRRTVEAGSVEEFLERFAHGDRLTEKAAQAVRAVERRRSCAPVHRQRDS